MRNPSGWAPPKPRGALGSPNALRGSRWWGNLWSRPRKDLWRRGDGRGSENWGFFSWKIEEFWEVNIYYKYMIYNICNIIYVIEDWTTTWTSALFFSNKKGWCCETTELTSKALSCSEDRNMAIHRRYLSLIILISHYQLLTIISHNWSLYNWN